MWFVVPKDAPVGQHVPLPMMPMIRLLQMQPPHSRFNSLHGRMNDHGFTDEASCNYTVLAMPSEMTEKWSSRVELSKSGTTKGMVCIPKDLDQAIRILSSRRGSQSKRTYWVRSACVYHDDAFEAAHFEGSYLLSIYSRATDVYFWIGGLSRKIAVAMDWIEAAAAHFIRHDRNRGNDVQDLEPWYADKTVHFDLGQDEDTALATFLSRPALLDGETWTLASAALNRNVPTYFINERGAVSTRYAYMICDYFIEVKPSGMSRSLATAVEKIKEAREQAGLLLTQLPQTIPHEAIYRSGTAKWDSKRIEQELPADSTSPYVEGYEHTVLEPGHGRRRPVSQTTAFMEQAREILK